MIARYYQKGHSIDYTPEVDTAAGTILFLGKLAAVTLLDIPAGELGAIAMDGVFEIDKDSSVFALGTPTYWDANAKKATATANEHYLGCAIKAAIDNDTKAYVLLNAGQSEYVAPDNNINA